MYYVLDVCSTFFFFFLLAHSNYIGRVLGHTWYFWPSSSWDILDSLSVPRPWRVSRLWFSFISFYQLAKPPSSFKYFSPLCCGGKMKHHRTLCSSFDVPTAWCSSLVVWSVSPGGISRRTATTIQKRNETKVKRNPVLRVLNSVGYALQFIIPSDTVNKHPF